MSARFVSCGFCRRMVPAGPDGMCSLCGRPGITVRPTEQRPACAGLRGERPCGRAVAAAGALCEACAARRGVAP